MDQNNNNINVNKEEEKLLLSPRKLSRKKNRVERITQFRSDSYMIATSHNDTSIANASNMYSLTHSLLIKTIKSGL